MLHAIRFLLLPNLALLHRFMIFGGIVLLVMGIGLAGRISDNVERDMVRSTAFTTALYVGGLLSSQMEEQEGTELLSEQDKTLLDMLFSPVHLGSEIVAIKVWSKDSTVLYSTNKDLIGKRFPTDRELKEALEGETEYEIAQEQTEENALERSQYRQLLEIYTPIRSQRTGEVIAASEIYQRMDRIPEFIHVSRQESWILIGLACLFVYMALCWIVKNASETIAQQNERLQEANRTLEEHAVTDFLTKLYNHRYFQERLTEEVGRSSRYQQPLSLLFCDLDRFKQLNDTYGHQTGDLVLRSTAQIVKNTVRATDVAARYGGEEYAIILTNTDKEGATAIAERIRHNVESNRMVLSDGREVRVTISIGVASFPLDAERKKSLVEEADRAMYAAKRCGRNRIVTCSAA